MAQSVHAPAPNVRFLTDAEFEEIDAKLSFFMEKQDVTEMLRLAKIYPLPAEQLEYMKQHFGMQFLLRNELNLANAVKKYGENWIED